MIECSWKSNYGIDCLTCGFQRSLEALFQGDLIESFLLFPATIPLLLVFVILPIHLAFKLKHGVKIIVTSFSFAALLIVINYSIKLSNNSFYHQHSSEIIHQL